MSFDAICYCELFFSMYLVSETVRSKVSLIFVDSSKNFLSGCPDKKSELGFVMTTGLPGKAVENISRYAWS